MAKVTCRILCVDDHQDTSEMLQLLLSQDDYHVVTSRSFEDALSLAQSGDFDLYVLDKRLPDGSGLELCQRLNQLKPHVPCILYTGDAYELHRREALEAGADAYVAKPDIDALIGAVEKLLAEQKCAGASGDLGSLQPPQS